MSRIRKSFKSHTSIFVSFLVFFVFLFMPSFSAHAANQNALYLMVSQDVVYYSISSSDSSINYQVLVSNPLSPAELYDAYILIPDYSSVAVVFVYDDYAIKSTWLYNAMFVSFICSELGIGAIGDNDISPSCTPTAVPSPTSVPTPTDIIFPTQIPYPSQIIMVTPSAVPGSDDPFSTTPVIGTGGSGGSGGSDSGDAFGFVDVFSGFSSTFSDGLSFVRDFLQTCYNNFGIYKIFFTLGLSLMVVFAFFKVLR